MTTPLAALLFIFAVPSSPAQTSTATSQPAPAQATCTVQAAASVTDADRAYASGEAAKAESLFAAQAGSAPTAANFAGLVHTQLEQNKLNEAKETAQRAVTAMPSSGDAEALMGEVLLRLGQIPEASAAYAKAIALDHCSARVHLGFARLNDLTSKHATAAREYGLAHGLAPKDPEFTAAYLLNLPGNLPEDKRAAAFQTFLGSSPLLPPAMVEKLTVAEAILEQHKNCTPVEANATAAMDLYGIMLQGTHARSWGLKPHINAADLPIFELDTSVSGIVMNPGDAKKAGVRPLLSTVGPANAGYYAVADHIRIGNTEYRDCTVRVVPAGELANSNSLIGTDFFRDRLIDINYVTKKVTLTPYAVDPASTSVAGAPTNRYISPQQKDWSATYVTGGNFLLPTLLNRKGQFLFALDTGSVSTIYSPTVNREVLLSMHEVDLNIHGYSGVIVKAIPKANGSDDDHALVTGPDGKLLRVNQPVKVPFLTFAGSEYGDNQGISYDISPKSRDMGIEISGLIGFGVLRDFYIDLDYRDGMVHLKYDLDHLYELREQNALTRPD